MLCLSDPHTLATQHIPPPGCDALGTISVQAVGCTHSRGKSDFSQLEIHPRVARLQVPVVRLSVLQLNQHRSVLRLPQEGKRKHGGRASPLPLSLSLSLSPSLSPSICHTLHIFCNLLDYSVYYFYESESIW